MNIREIVDERRHAVITALRVKGFADGEVVAEAASLSADEAGALLDALGQAGLAKRREGAVSGWSLTPDGRAAHAEGVERERERTGAVEALETSYAAFVPLNTDLKAACSDWQIRTTPDGDQAPNDHEDAGYDAAVIGRIGDVHRRTLAEVVEPLQPACARFSSYATRFTSAWERIENGDHSAVARPLSGSYHDVWMELHQDLLVTLGKDRSAADGH